MLCVEGRLFVAMLNQRCCCEEMGCFFVCCVQLPT